MLGLLNEAGHELVEDPRGADVAIVNTCAFIAAAVEESRSVVQGCLDLKQRGELGRVVVAGCLPQRLGEGVLDAFDGVDGVVGSSCFDEIPEVLKDLGDTPVCRIEWPHALYDDDLPRIRATPAHLAYVKIAEGCSNRCSYCTIPSIRGPLRSRAPESISAEVRRLVDEGVREINLIAQDTTAYGTDVASGIDLERLLEELCTTGAPWIRVLYAHPAHISEELLFIIGREECIVPYIDVPIQHVSDRILGAMGRRTDGAGIRRLLERIREVIPDVTVRSSVIVGFPGESEEEFEALLEFLAEGHVDHLGVFEYSPEPGTRARDMPDQVPGEVAALRAERLMNLAHEMAVARGRAAVGTEVVALVDDERSGRTWGQAWETDGALFWTPGANPAPEPGTFVRARIVGVRDFDLEAEIVSPPNVAPPSGERC